MNFGDDEIWVTHPKFVCLIAKFDNQENKLLITKQGILQIDKEIREEYIDDKSNIKVDPLSKQGVNDLLLLNELNEFNCLHGIRMRYSKKSIYTQVGTPILVAINPYQYVPEFYDQKMVTFYKKEMGRMNQISKDILQQKLRDIDPHLYKVAQMSLDQLFEETTKTNLRICSMIISGESGSGKTESTKIILKYLAAEQPGSKSKAPSIEQQVFASNPLLEAFGNAKTARNDNSSRFGKFIHLYFNPVTKRITNAKIDNYLLEKSRVVKLSQVERNYHIFYQLIAAQIPDLKLGQAKQYHYLKQGDLKFVKNELEEFKETSECMDKMNFTPQEKQYIFQILAGILHLGNMSIQGDANKSFIIEDFSLKASCQLLGLDSDDMTKIICKVQTLMGKEIIMKENSIDSACSARDTLAKHIYEKLFNWLIERVNSQLQAFGSKLNQQIQSQYMIGILDIFGFEIFTDEQGIQTNSFEQLNINFTNEKLQQHFNSHMLETEQSEYNIEKITWNHIKFPDNKQIIDVIENSTLSIYKLLIDQTIAPKGNDREFSNSFKKLPRDCVFNVQDLLAQDSNIKVDKKHKTAKFDWFGIKHFAGCVIYNVYGFIDKNKDTINQEVHQVLPTSKNPIIREIWKSHQITNPNIKQNNVITRFQNSLQELLEVLNKSLPKYIRCIKPNNTKTAFEFDAQEVRRQMRCAGLLEAIQIRKAGYEIRLNHLDFMKKYRYLIKGKPSNINQMIILLNQNQKVKEKIQKELELKNVQIGTTKIFMKEGLRDFLDQMLIEFRMQFIIKIQKASKKYIYKKTIFQKLKILLKRHQKLQRSCKWYAFKFILQKRITNRLILNSFIFTIQKYERKIIQSFAFSKLNQYAIFLIKRDVELKRQQQELEKELQIENSGEINKSVIISSKFVEDESSINISQPLQTSVKVFTKPEMVSNSNSIDMFKKALQDTQQKLKLEQQKRRDLENQVEKLQNDLLQFESSGRETLNPSTFGQLEDIFTLQKITEEKQILEVQVEQLQFEKKKIEKNSFDQIQNLGLQLAHAQQCIKEMEHNNEVLTQDYLNEVKAKEEIEEKLKDEWNQERRLLLRELEDSKKALQNQTKIAQKDISRIKMEYDREKLKVVELESEVKKFQQLSELYKSQLEQNDSHNSDNKGNEHELQMKDLQLRDLQVEIQKRDQIISQLNNQIKEQQSKSLAQSQTISQINDNSEITQELNEKIISLSATLAKRELEQNRNKKLISVMNNLIKLKIIEVNALHKHFNIFHEQQKQDIYKPISQIMEKEKLLMKQIEDLIKQNNKEQAEQTENQQKIG
ncbi:unnamed protein product [Paramecium sonneborni]|uniref:Myosin motor domain-containing protein n=1 Tax=Paramecium sonneborni TaxID=65129 RepID=A0A8S1M557_9CILI|nr:unnamed protein product [Paramecium sonneborni]